MPYEELAAGDCPFCAILAGQNDGKVIARDEARAMAIIEDLHPEGAVHWLALPYEHMESTETMMHEERQRFSDLIDFAVEETHRRSEDYPSLRQGFTIKIHCGAYETYPHAKLHILSVE